MNEQRDGEKRKQKHKRQKQARDMNTPKLWATKAIEQKNNIIRSNEQRKEKCKKRNKKKKKKEKMYKKARNIPVLLYCEIQV